MDISKEFDGGNIEVIDSSDPMDVQLGITADRESGFYQWFFFRVTGIKARPCRFRIVNAGGAAYPDGFKDYRVCYSHDRERWRRSASKFNEGELIFEFTSDCDSVYFAYFVPYPMERHHKLIARAQTATHCSTRILGRTLDDQDLDQLTFSSAASFASASTRKQCWIIARQHPGETMAEWWMEGCINKLMDSNSALTQALLENCELHLVPNMNPDGSRRGHLRTNAAGRNLNREWAEPSMESSPEVFLVRQAMADTGVDFLLDVHGDESLPYCFIAGTEGLSNWGEAAQRPLDFYKNRLAELNADFQTKAGYPVKRPGTANLTMSTTQIASRYGCLAMTLEMPFKDTSATPDAESGWSPARSGKLAESCLQALAALVESGLMR